MKKAVMTINDINTTELTNFYNEMCDEIGTKESIKALKAFAKNELPRFQKNGNTKIGQMYSWNTLAGNGEIGGCKGTCGNFCQGCYNADDPKKSPCYCFSAYVRYGWDDSSVAKGHIRNTNFIRGYLKMTFFELARSLTAARKKPAMVRIHSSGEFETSKEILCWFALAKKFPDIKFYSYTKNTGALGEAMSIVDIPENLFFNVSIWHQLGVTFFKEHQKNSQIRAYVYDDGFDYESLGIKASCHCPAYVKDKNDKTKLIHDLTCDKCGICFQQKAKVCFCLDH